LSCREPGADDEWFGAVRGLSESIAGEARVGRSVVALAALVGAALASGASAQQLPTDVDLKAAYCIPIAQQLAGLSAQVWKQAEAAESAQEATDKRELLNLYRQPDQNAASSLDRLNLHLAPRVPADTLKLYRQAPQDAESNLNRLKLYLVPRMPYLDTFALTAAMKRGQDDYATVMAATNDATITACVAECFTSHGQIEAAAQSCQSQCATPSLRIVLERVQAHSCGNPTWLAF
jgi:hypothetical protein